MWYSDHNDNPYAFVGGTTRISDAKFVFPDSPIPSMLHTTFYMCCDEQYQLHRAVVYIPVRNLAGNYCIVPLIQIENDDYFLYGARDLNDREYELKDFLHALTNALLYIEAACGSKPNLRNFPAEIMKVIEARLERRRRKLLEPLMRIRRRLFIARYMARRWADRWWNPYTSLGMKRLITDYKQMTEGYKNMEKRWRESKKLIVQNSASRFLERT